ncbi:MAG: hypothetical protein WCZ23_07450, partial [Rhodospirillaceae bacterium]
AYRPFNMVVADNRDAFWIRHAGLPAHAVEAFPLPEGLSMLTAFDIDDAKADPRIALHRPRFLTVGTPDPDAESWGGWQGLLSSRDGGGATGERSAAMCFQMETGFGTRSSSLIALPSPERAQALPVARPTWLFAPGPPDCTPYAPVDLA